MGADTRCGAKHGYRPGLRWKGCMAGETFMNGTKHMIRALGASALVWGGLSVGTEAHAQVDRGGREVVGDLGRAESISLTGNQRFDFPNGFVAGGTVQIKSGIAQFTNTAAMLWWTSANVWNNTTNDDAALFNCLGQQVDFFDDGV